MLFKMKDLIKNERQIKIMREGGKKLSRILVRVAERLKPGLNTLEIDSWIEEMICRSGGKPSFKTVPGYHWASCIGFNEEVVHSIPKKEKIIKEGDLVKVDIGMLWRGFHTDMAWTTIVQSSKCKVQSYQREFLDTGKRALEEAIKVAVAGNRVGHISRAIQETIEAGGYSPVKVLTGHEIGRRLHEELLIPGVLKGRIEDTKELSAGMTLALEVIYNQGSPEVVLNDDGWTIETKDGKISGLFEKTIAVTEKDPLIITPMLSA